MNNVGEKTLPCFGADLTTLIWPMPLDQFFLSAMHNNVFYQAGSTERLAILEDQLNSYSLTYLFDHGVETTIWKEGGKQTNRGTDTALDLETLIEGTTIQTHLQKKMPFARNFVMDIANQMNLESGFFSIFASRDTHTDTHYDRNYNFTIQLSGEKTWHVYGEQVSAVNPTRNVALRSDRLSLMANHMHGARINQPYGNCITYHLSPGDILYVPPGFWHSTECKDLSISLNVSLEPKPWFKVIGDSLIRHLEEQMEWRKPYGVPSEEIIEIYLESLRQVVSSMTPGDINPRPHQLRSGESLRRGTGSLLIWEVDGAGLYYGEDELRFLALGTKGRLIEVTKCDMEPVLKLLSDADYVTTIEDVSSKTDINPDRIKKLMQQLFDFGYLTSLS